MLVSKVDHKLFPGVVVLIEREGAGQVELAAGTMSYDPSSPPMMVDMLFDIASITKVFTAVAVMQLVEHHVVEISDTVGKYFQNFHMTQVGASSILHLMTHTSGLGSLPRELVATLRDKDDLIQAIFASQLAFRPGTCYQYSDLGFILLGSIIEQATERSLDEYMTAAIFQPLELRETLYRPSEDYTDRIAPTESTDEGVVLHGVVHDEKARLLGGVAGHSGLFSTARDLNRFLMSFIRAVLGEEEVIVKSSTARRMITSHTDHLGVAQGLGWLLHMPFMGKHAGQRAFGHTGFTGTSILADADSLTRCVILTNCVHPTRPDSFGRAELLEFRAQVADFAATFEHYKGSIAL